MRRSLVAALLALLLLTVPAQAQPTEHTLIDATVKVEPGEDTGLCWKVDSNGTIRAALHTTDDRDSDPLGPPKLMLAPYRTSPPGMNAPQEIWDQPVTAAKTSLELPVVPRLYCFSLTLPTTPEISALPSVERRTRFRYVALHVTFTPD